MTEQIKPVQRYTIDWDRELRADPDGGVVLYDDHTETVQQLQRENAELKSALDKINDIRNSIIGFQTLNWSEHVYPLVVALNSAGIVGLDYPEARYKCQTLLDELAAAKQQLAAAMTVVEQFELGEYDAGSLNSYGGGNVGWWQDYVRYELNRAYECYKEQVDSLIYAARIAQEDKHER